MNDIPKKPECLLTIDLEEWYHGAYPGYSYGMISSKISRIVPATEMILEVLGQFGATATFFVLGDVAKSHPELVCTIFKNGHEIASHGFSHTLISGLGKENFGKDVAQSLETIGSLIGCQPMGYRAPNFSLHLQKTPWAFEILGKLGFEYDSSIFPAIMYYGGAIRASRFISQVEGMEEFPVSCFGISRICFSGGFYFRAFPKWLIDNGIQSYLKREQTPILYLHPKDIDPETPKLPLGVINNFAHRHSCKTALDKLLHFVEKYRFISIQEYREQAISK